MDDVNVYLMDLSFEGNTSGINRYLSILANQLKENVSVHVFQIRFLAGRSVLFYQENEKGNYTEVIVPLPIQMKEIINERYWLQKYNEYVFSLIGHLFENKTNPVIHIHTLNLIALASYIKNKIPCKIITHLHCIPWKDHYDKNRKLFNQLYPLDYSISGKILTAELFLSNNCEWESYTASDKVICVTNSGKDFLQNSMQISGENIKVIYNGINDLGNDNSNKEPRNASDTIQCLFVGFLSESKGIFYILRALRQVQTRGYRVVLNMAGAYNPSERNQISKKYNDLHVNLLGRISFEELQKYYQESDIGIIASLQEQCSYVAIEMAMFGLPIVTTAVDGLDEIFTDGVDALKVNTLFSKVFDLRVDVDMMADKIISLIENDALRQQLGENARKLYKERFNLETMMQKTVEEYKSLFYAPPQIKHKAKTSILFCIETLNDGGAEKVLIDILENMNPDKYVIDLLVIQKIGVYFERIPAYVNWFTLLDAGDNLSKSFDIEVAFLEGFTTKIVAYRKSNAYKIAWVHIDLQAMHWSKSAYSNEGEEELCYSKMNQIVFVSGQSQSTFNQMFPNLKVPQQVIHNPIDREVIVAASEAITVSKNKFTMCSIGRLVGFKGYVRLIAVLNDLVLDGLDFEFWILGKGEAEQQQELENLIKLYSLENVVYLKGFHKNPYPYLKAADMYVAASFAEGFSLALCEAVCLGKPILATRVSGANEILNNGECGLIVEQDPQAIYEGLKRMMGDEELRKSLSNKAFVHAEKLFNIRKVMEKIGYLFKNKTT